MNNDTPMKTHIDVAQTHINVAHACLLAKKNLILFNIIIVNHFAYNS
jgi:hypothetical protein